jgi:hypothetical protein
MLVMKGSVFTTTFVLTYFMTAPLLSLQKMRELPPVTPVALLHYYGMSHICYPAAVCTGRNKVAPHIMFFFHRLQNHVIWMGIC